MAKTSPLIENKQDLIQALSRGCKPKSQWRIGTEHEKFGYCNDELTPLPYGGKCGIEQLMASLRDGFGWTPMMEEGKLIGLKAPRLDSSTDILGSITLEPGGQFELSGAPLSTIHETCREVHSHLRQVRAVGDVHCRSFIGLGFAPTWKLADVPIMPKGRYKIMREYMQTVGTLGREMMFRSATVQVNLDFESEADMLKKLRVSLALQPIATAIFANSPFADGKPNGFKSYRSEVWKDTDNARTGMLPFMFEDGAGFESYVDHALDVPMYFVYRDGHYINATGESFRDFLDGKLNCLPGEKPTISDWEDHLTTLFPEVRMKQFLEMRGADAGSWQNLCALPALWVGLLYDSAALDQAYELIKDWSTDEMLALRNAVPKDALQTPFRNGTVQDIAKQMVEISRQGLAARDLKDTSGVNETVFLENLFEITSTGRTHADVMLEQYHGEWAGDINRIFKEYSY
ncbi:MAG: glutamate--cysteine ligase [Rhizobiales bacterium]|nr:glutamate--cysteine ligase [Hyphomicrobiales bacterium]NRB13537.1 glutamate--cysteine ligase [Hyphomicrobiales bacterium]